MSENGATAGGHGTGAAQARVGTVLRVAFVGVMSGVLLFAGIALVLAPLTALDPTAVRMLRLYGALLGAVVAIATAALGPSGEPPGARLATRVGFIVGVSATVILAISTAIALAIAPLVDGRVERATIVALSVGCFGLALTVAALAGLAASTTRRPGRLPSSGMPLPWLVGGATSIVTAATWALSVAHLVGHLDANARQTSVEEARDLAVLLGSLGPEGSDHAASELAPPGGFIARLAPTGEILPGTTAGIERSAALEIDDGPPTLCRIRKKGERTRSLPCGVRTLSDGTRVVAATSDVSFPLEPVMVFVCIGLSAVTLALAAGVALGRGTAADLARVATVLDQLGRIDGGLDRSIVAVSLDEVGDLAVALDRLRLQLRPGLLEHDEALTRARAANDERDRLLALVSEELRLPLDRILGDASLLLDGDEELTAPQREDIRLIVSSATHLTGLIEEVLDLSAIATGQVSLHVGICDLGAVVTDVARAQKPLVGARDVAIEVALPQDGPVSLAADERRLRQVVTNLVSNAVKFTPAGTITLTVVREDGHVIMTVRDSGIGMDRAQIPRLFSEFVQLGTLRERARGTGLGLAICKRIIEAHGGTVAADSELGRGTVFTVRLPIAGRAPA